MNRMTAFLCLLWLPFAALAAPPPGAADDEEALLLAWERVQLADPKTQVFERTAPRVYRFKTQRFPYDGILRVANIAVQPTSGRQFLSGMVEVRLDRPNAELRDEFPMSFPQWVDKNSLVKDLQSGRWLTIAEWSRLRQQRLASQSWWEREDDLLGLTIFIGLGTLLLGAVVAAVRYQLAMTRKMRDDDLIRQKLLADAGGVGARDARIFSVLEQQQRLLEEALSGARGTRRWRPKGRAMPSMSAADSVVEFALTQDQRERLKFYWALRGQDDARPFFRTQKTPRRTWIAAAVILFCVAALSLLGWMKASSFALGLVLGMVVIVLGTRESFAALWPALRRTLDWRKIEALLNDDVSRRDARDR